MQRTMFHAKIHRARVTEADLDYEGSVSIDQGLLEKSGILPYEQVHIYDLTNGERIVTYAIPAPPGSGKIGINGAAAHKVRPHDLVIIVAYATLSEEEARQLTPKVILVDENNQPR